MLSCTCGNDGDEWLTVVGSWLALKIVLTVWMFHMLAPRPFSFGLSLLGDFLGTLFALLV